MINSALAYVGSPPDQRARLSGPQTRPRLGSKGRYVFCVGGRKGSSAKYVLGLFLDFFRRLLVVGRLVTAAQFFMPEIVCCRIRLCISGPLSFSRLRVADRARSMNKRVVAFFWNQCCCILETHLARVEQACFYVRRIRRWFTLLTVRCTSRAQKRVWMLDKLNYDWFEVEPMIHSRKQLAAGNYPRPGCL